MSAHRDAVPYLSLHHGLEVQSSPIPLATRSLSARSSNSSLSTSSLNHRLSSTNSRGSSIRPKDARRPTSAMRRVKASKKQNENFVSIKPASESSKETPQSNSLEPKYKQTIEVAQKGFNIAGHLRNSVELDRSSGSLSPDVDQFLKDIGALVRPITPDPQSPALHHSWDNSHAHQTDKSAAESTLETLNDRSPKPHRPKVAAKFGVIPNQTLTTAVPNLLLDPLDPYNITKAHEVNSPPHTRVEHPPLDQNVAARKIQSWYRKKCSSQLSNVQNVLQKKKDELNCSRVQELLDSETKEVEKQQRRAAKMQAARKAAIDELNKKREEKRIRAEKIAQGEIVSVLAQSRCFMHLCNKLEHISKPQSIKWVWLPVKIFQIHSIQNIAIHALNEK